MNVKEALTEGAELLKAFPTPFLDAALLLSNAAEISREKLFASFPDTLSGEVYKRYTVFLRERLAGYPVSYILGKKEFYGLEFHVDSRVLDPRPDTEILVESALSIIDDYAAAGIENSSVEILDLCTGSGCIAISLKKNRPGLSVSASDISPGALECCELNCSRLLEDPVRLYISDLFHHVPGVFDIIISNPPYLTDNEVADMMSSGCPEPEIALKAGSDGLDLIRSIISKSFDRLKPDGYLLIEAAHKQSVSIRNLMEETGYIGVCSIQDLSGQDRVSRGKKPSR